MATALLQFIRDVLDGPETKLNPLIGIAQIIQTGVAARFNRFVKAFKPLRTHQTIGPEFGDNWHAGTKQTQSTCKDVPLMSLRVHEQNAFIKRDTLTKRIKSLFFHPNNASILFLKSTGGLTDTDPMIAKIFLGKLKIQGSISAIRKGDIVQIKTFGNVVKRNISAQQPKIFRIGLNRNASRKQPLRNRKNSDRPNISPHIEENLFIFTEDLNSRL